MHLWSILCIFAGTSKPFYRSDFFGKESPGNTEHHTSERKMFVRA